jgi:hypothetical protein
VPCRDLFPGRPPDTTDGDARRTRQGFSLPLKGFRQIRSELVAPIVTIGSGPSARTGVSCAAMEDLDLVHRINAVEGYEQ